MHTPVSTHTRTRTHTHTGRLPEDWSTLSLQVIHLDQNRLEGPLPGSWFGDSPLSSSLRVLTLWDNKLSGPLPAAEPGSLQVCAGVACVEHAQLVVQWGHVVRVGACCAHAHTRPANARCRALAHLQHHHRPCKPWTCPSMASPAHCRPAGRDWPPCASCGWA
jgi:hypothetical protein